MLEIMIAISIIGVLATIMVPNYKKYQSRAKTPEAYVQLANAFAAQQSFFNEFGIYHACLVNMGYNPTAETSSRYYAIGFDEVDNIDSNAFADALNSGMPVECDGDATVDTRINGKHFFAAGKGGGGNPILDVSAALTVLGNQSGFANQTFTIAAVGIIASTNSTPATASQITINQDKTTSVVNIGY